MVCLKAQVLGPVLFSLYTQDICNIVNSYKFNLHVFADDMLIYLPCNEKNNNLQLLQDCFKEVQRWASNNFLKLNDTKSKFMLISSKCCKTLPFPNEQKTAFEKLVKNLGFYFDNNLTFSTQINKVCQHGFHLLRNLWKISSKLTDVSLKIQIVQSTILSHIDYCNSLYIHLPQKQICKLQRLMNAVIRFIFNLRRSDRVSITHYMKLCHFLPVKLRIEFKIALLVYKCFNHSAPTYLQNLVLPKVSLQSLRVSDDKHLLQTPKLYQQDYKNRQFSIVAPQIWNSLPHEIRSSSSKMLFKSKLKTFLFDTYFE